MADPSPAATLAVRRSAFHGLCVPGRLGQAEGSAGVTVSERAGLALVTVIARRGMGERVAATVGDALGLSLPLRPQAVPGDGVTAVWAGPDQWLLVAAPGHPAAEGNYPGAGLHALLSRATEGAAAVIDHTDARGVLRISGPRARDTLAKGVGIDLHPRAFSEGSTALTRCSLIDVTLWQVDDEPTYDIAVARGFSGSFWHWLVDSASEYGIAVV